MIEQILFPVDFSPSCAAMAAYVQRVAAIYKSEVTILYVCDLASHSGFELYARPGNEIAEEHWNIARSKLDRFLTSEFPPATCRRILSAGDAASVIAQTAKKNFDLVVMPTHAGRFRRMLLGSTTSKVLDEAECPVLTMQHAETIAPRSLEHRHWACAIGLSVDSERVLRYAKDAASAAGAKLAVIHAIPADEGRSDPKEVSQAVRRAHQGVAALQGRVGSQASVGVTVGKVKEALLHAARESNADVLVVGRSPHAHGIGRMRDLTYALIRDSPCPVVSV